MKLFALSISLFMCGLVILLSESSRKEVMINCSIAEISPDIPPKAKELCREARKK